MCVVPSEFPTNAIVPYLTYMRTNISEAHLAGFWHQINILLLLLNLRHTPLRVFSAMLLFCTLRKKNTVTFKSFSALMRYSRTQQHKLLPLFKHVARLEMMANTLAQIVRASKGIVLRRVVHSVWKGNWTKSVKEITFSAA